MRLVKPAIFHNAARETIRVFPHDVRRSFGKAIWELQKGTRLGMPLSKPMPSVGAGVDELRVKDASGAYRGFTSPDPVAGFSCSMRSRRSREGHRSQRFVWERST